MEPRLHRRPSLAAIVLAGLVVPLLRAQLPTGAAAQPLPSVPSLQEAAIERLREECFVLEDRALVDREGTDAVASSGGVVGLARCRRLELEDGWQLEWDVRFPDEETRVLHIERWTSAGTTLIWRELRPQSGRTLTAVWTGDGPSLLLREWGGVQRLELQLDAPGGGILPLSLLELVRCGAVEEGTLRTFDPLGRRFEDLRLTETRDEDGLRRIELVRADGTLAGVWHLEGVQLLGFQWQGGNLRARRVEAEEYEERLQPAPPPEPEVAHR